MSEPRPTRILIDIDTDTATPDANLLQAIDERATDGHTQFRLVVLDPSRAEVHLLHPSAHEGGRPRPSERCTATCRCTGRRPAVVR